MKNLRELLSASVSKFPNKLAIIFGQQKISFKDLDVLSTRIACGLLNLGVKKGDRVALLLANSPHFIISYFAIVKIGAVVVPINNMFKLEEVSYVVSDSQVSFLITSTEFLDMAIRLQRGISCLKGIVSVSKKEINFPNIYEWVNNPAKDTDISKITIAEDDSAVILYTSGTTGRPKGAILSHKNIASNVNASKKAIDATSRDRVVCILPLFHSFAATVCMLLPLSCGAAVVVMRSPRPFKRLLRLVRKNRVRIFVGVPSFFHILSEVKLPKTLKYVPFLLRYAFPFRVCISGAAALPVPVWEKFSKRFRVSLLEGYGLTESSPVVSLNPFRGVNKPGSVGFPVADVQVKIVDEDGKEREIGQVGEIIVQGPNVMKGYLNNPQATQETIRGGWLFTGDLGKMDKDGYIYIVGRKKDMINVRGLNVYPREIEDLLVMHPAIKEAAVIGIADYHKGEIPKGFVVLKEGKQVAERELINYLREHLANYKIPRHFEFRNSLPKNTTGKILKRKLIEEEQK